MKLHWHRFGMLFVLGALAMGLLAACSSDSESDSEAETETTPAATTETAATPEPTTTVETTPEATTEAPAEAAVVAVTLSEWAIELDADTVAAGEVTFNVANEGAIPHELTIVKTDLAPDALPTDAGLATLDGLDVIGQVAEFAAGTTAEGTFTLDAGTYVLICNLPAHYEQGMAAALTVE